MLATGGATAFITKKFLIDRPHKEKIYKFPIKNIPLINEKPDMINPPTTDSGTLPNLRFAFDDAHIRKSTGGWTRQITKRELAISNTIAGVNMRLYKGGIRELHWHKEAEWAYMLYGKARITAIDIKGKWFIKDVNVGDLWYFPPGIPHSIQGLSKDGCEFLLVFDNGNFDEESTFLLSDWFKHIPIDILAKNFNTRKEIFKNLPSPEKKYIFSGEINNKIYYKNIKMTQNSRYKFSYKLMNNNIIKTKKGEIYIADSSTFHISKNISAALVLLEPGSIRELHWHPNNDEWQYYISGQGRMGVFASSGQARTFDFKSRDVGYVPFAMGHYIQNTGPERLIFLEIFNSNYYADISLNQWLAVTPPYLVQQHLNLNNEFIENLNRKKCPII